MASKRSVSGDDQVRVGDSADRVNSSFHAFARDQCADHKHNVTILRNSEFCASTFPWMKSFAVHTIWNEPAIPIVLVSIEELWIYADQTITTEEAIFGGVAGRSAGKSGPISVLSHKNVWRSAASEFRSTKYPICERIAARQSYVIMSRVIIPDQLGNEGQFLVPAFISEKWNIRKPLKIFPLDAA